MALFANSKADVLKPTIAVEDTNTTTGDYVNNPSYTTAERDALTGMVAGSQIFNSTTSKLNFYTGSAWEAVTSA